MKMMVERESARARERERERERERAMAAAAADSLSTSPAASAAAFAALGRLREREREKTYRGSEMIRVRRLREPPGGAEERELDRGGGVGVEALEEGLVRGRRHGFLRPRVKTRLKN